MILLKQDMIKALERGDIYINKWIKEEDLNPNSINVSLGDTLKTYTPFKIKKTKEGLRFVKSKDVVLDAKKKNKIYEYEIPEEGIILSPDMFYLGYTVEKAGSDVYVPMYEGRSSLARLGLVSHLSAGFGDVGFKSQWTLEIAVKEPLKIYKGMQIGQVYFVKGTSDYPVHKYVGKYNDQIGPLESKLYLDFKDEVNCEDSLECIIGKIKDLEEELRNTPKSNKEQIKIIQLERDRLNKRLEELKVSL